MTALPPVVELGTAAAAGVVGFVAVLYWTVRAFYGDRGRRPENPPSPHGSDRRPPGAE